jgi:hypothetical protein
LQVPDGYTFDENPEEDKKYYEALNSFKELVEQIHNVEVAASEQT